MLHLILEIVAIVMLVLVIIGVIYDFSFAPHDLFDDAFEDTEEEPETQKILIIATQDVDDFIKDHPERKFSRKDIDSSPTFTLLFELPVEEAESEQ